MFVLTESSIFDILTDAVFLSNQLILQPQELGCVVPLICRFFSISSSDSTTIPCWLDPRMQNPKKYTGTIDKEIDKSHMDF